MSALLHSGKTPLVSITSAFYGSVTTNLSERLVDFIVIETADALLTTLIIIGIVFTWYQIKRVWREAADDEEQQQRQEGKGEGAGWTGAKVVDASELPGYGSSGVASFQHYFWRTKYLLIYFAAYWFKEALWALYRRSEPFAQSSMTARVLYVSILCLVVAFLYRGNIE